MGMVAAWLERVDPGMHRRIKGLRLVMAYGIAAMLGTLQGVNHGLPSGASLSSLAGGIALWASVSEARSTRAASSRDLFLLCMAATCGAVSMIILTPWLSGVHRPGPELTLAAGAYPRGIFAPLWDFRGRAGFTDFHRSTTRIRRPAAAG
jgi:hypothetical protein